MKLFNYKLFSAVLIALIFTAASTKNSRAQIAFDQLGPMGGDPVVVAPMLDGRVIVKDLGSRWAYESLDDGLSWSFIDGGLPEVLGRSTIVRLNDGTVYAAIYDAVGFSSDFGRTWIDYQEHVGLAPFMISSSLAVMNREQLIMGGGVPAVLFTKENSAAGWTQLAEVPGMMIPQYISTFGSSEIAVYGLSSITGDGSSTTAHSSDLGQTWTTKETTSFFSELLFTSNGSQMACTLDGVERLGSPSEEWTKVVGEGLSCLDVEVLTDGTILASLSNRMFRSADDGLNWDELNLNEDIFFIGQLTSGTVIATSHQGVLRSTDMGQTWSHSGNGIAATRVNHLLRTSTGEMIVSLEEGVKVVDAMQKTDPFLFDPEGFQLLVGLQESDTGDVYATSWRGNVKRRDASTGTWTSVRSADSRVFNSDIRQNSIALAGNGELWFSSQRGESWVNLFPLIPGSDSFDDKSVYDVAFTDEAIMVLGMETGVFELILSTVGPIWTQLKSGPAYRIEILNDGTILSRSNGMLAVQSPGSDTWSEAAFEFEFDSPFTGSPFFETGDGDLFIPETDGLVRSTDFGQTWSKVEDWPYLYSSDIHLDPDGRLYLATSTGVHVSTSISVDTEAFLDLPSSSGMLSVYPLPVLNSATFQFSIDRASAVRVEVYNILGQKVFDAYDGMLSSGQHDVSADFSNLARGTYLSRLTIDGRPAATSTIIKSY